MYGNLACLTLRVLWHPQRQQVLHPGIIGGLVGEVTKPFREGLAGNLGGFFPSVPLAISAGEPVSFNWLITHRFTPTPRTKSPKVVRFFLGFFSHGRDFFVAMGTENGCNLIPLQRNQLVKASSTTIIGGHLLPDYPPCPSQRICNGSTLPPLAQTAFAVRFIPSAEPGAAVTNGTSYHANPSNAQTKRATVLRTPQPFFTKHLHPVERI